MADETTFSTLDELLKATDTSNVSSEGTGFGRLPDGCYKVEINKAELTTSKTGGKDMVKLTLKIIDDGVATDYDEFGNPTRSLVKGSKGRMEYKYYPLTTIKQVQNFTSDMLKFVDENDAPIIDKSYLKTKDSISMSLQLIEGMYIWISLNTSLKLGLPKDTQMNEENTNQWVTLLSWKRAKANELE